MLESWTSPQWLTLVQCKKEAVHASTVFDKKNSGIRSSSKASRDVGAAQLIYTVQAESAGITN